MPQDTSPGNGRSPAGVSDAIRAVRAVALAAFAGVVVAVALVPRRGSADAKASKLHQPDGFILALPAFKVQGAGTCGGPQCHGGAANADGSYKPGSENTIWTDVDRHSRAYRTLTNAKSKAMAKNVAGLGSPVKSERCLSCHAVNVPAAQQGGRVQPQGRRQLLVVPRPQ